MESGVWEPVCNLERSSNTKWLKSVLWCQLIIACVYLCMCVRVFVHKVVCDKAGGCLNSHWAQLGAGMVCVFHLIMGTRRDCET